MKMLVDFEKVEYWCKCFVKEEFFEWFMLFGIFFFIFEFFFMLLLIGLIVFYFGLGISDLYVYF